MNKQFDYLFVDFMVEESHKLYCNDLVLAINQSFSSLAVGKAGYFENQPETEHQIIPIKTKPIVGYYPIKARIHTVYNYINTIKAIRNHQFKKVIVLGYDPSMFSLMFRKLLKSGDVYLVEHHQLDEVDTSAWKQWLWKRYKDLVHHIVLDSSIVGPMASRFHIDIGRIHVFPHPCITKREDSKQHHSEHNEIKVLGISNSNDLDQMKRLVELEKKTHCLEKKGISIIIRKNDLLDVSDLPAFEEIEGYLSEEEYNELYRSCNMVLMPFPLDYQYRCSGTLIDALASGKKVLSSNTLEAATYAKLFPQICQIYEDICDIWSIIPTFFEGDADKPMEAFFEYQIQMREKGLKEITE